MLWQVDVYLALQCIARCNSIMLYIDTVSYYTPTHRVGMSGGYIAITLSVRPSVCPSVHTFVTDISASTGRIDFMFDIWLWHGDLYRLPFPGLQHIYFLFTVRLRIFHVCRNENFRNSYLSFYWKKWFYIWYMALAWWLVPCLPFPGLSHIYFLFTVRLTNERVGVFLARRSVQRLVILLISIFVFICTIINICNIFYGIFYHRFVFEDIFIVEV